MTSSTLATTGLKAGVWDIDPVHSTLGFTVRHMMVSKVRGHFREFEGTINVAEDFTKSTGHGTVTTASIDTGTPDRDNHLRTNDFFDAENYPTIEYDAKGVRVKGDGYVVIGDITIKGVTKPLELDLEITGVGLDAYGKTRAGLNLTGQINRQDFGVSWSANLDGGGVVVSDKVNIELDLAAVLRSE